MSREIKKDFDELVLFIRNYNLESLSMDPNFINVISQQHKKLFSYLTCVAELIQQSEENTNNQKISSNQLNYIIESCSDIGSALFVMTHGAYKASRMMLRSSIENFNKGFNLDTIPSINQERSVFIIFDKIKSLDFFNKEPIKSIFNLIHQDYKLLCQDTHTAMYSNMQHITALNYFPNFIIENATQVSDILIRLISLYNTLICIKYNEYFLKMHHRNKENIILNIPRKYRPIIHGVL